MLVSYMKEIFVFIFNLLVLFWMFIGSVYKLAVVYICYLHEADFRGGLLGSYSGVFQCYWS
jgi:hypothetical protein